MTRTPTIAKRLARERQARTGQPYTLALRTVQDEYRQAQADQETPSDHQPGSGESQHE